MASMRAKLGALLFEGPIFLFGLATKFGWVKIRNRGDLLQNGPIFPGVIPRWENTCGLHFCKVFPWASSILLERCRHDAPFGEASSLGDSGVRVSVLLGHRGPERDSNLFAVLASIAAQRGVEVECVVCEQDHKPHIGGALPAWVRYIFDRVPEGQPYNRSRALNLAAAAASGEILVLHDNDLLIPEQYALAHAKALASGWDVANLKRFIFYLAKGERSSGRSPRIEHVMQNARGGGSLAIRKESFLAIGGMDEGFTGWGGEDVEFWDRCRCLRLCDSQFLPLIHLWHTDQPGKRAIGGKGSLTAEHFQSSMQKPVSLRIADLRGRQQPGKNQ